MVSTPIFDGVEDLIAAEALKIQLFCKRQHTLAEKTSFGGFIAGQCRISCGIITVSLILDCIVEQGESDFSDSHL